MAKKTFAGPKDDKDTLVAGAGDTDDNILADTEAALTPGGERVEVMRAFACRTGRTVRDAKSKGSVGDVFGQGGLVIFHDDETHERVQLLSGDIYNMLITQLQELEKRQRPTNPLFVEPGSQKEGHDYELPAPLPQSRVRATFNDED